MSTVPEALKDAPIWKMMLLDLFNAQSGKLMHADLNLFASENSLSFGTVRSAYYRFIELVQREELPMPSPEVKERARGGPKLWHEELRMMEATSVRVGAPMFRHLAQKYDAIPKTIENYYQRNVRGKVAKLPDVPDEIKRQHNWIPLIQIPIEELPAWRRELYAQMALTPVITPTMPFMRALAEKHGMPYTTISSDYYRIIKKLQEKDTQQPYSDYMQQVLQRETEPKPTKPVQQQVDEVIKQQAKEKAKEKPKIKQQEEPPKVLPTPQTEEPKTEEPKPTAPEEANKPSAPGYLTEFLAQNPIVQALIKHNVTVRSSKHLEEIEDYLEQAELPLIFYAIKLSADKHTAYLLATLQNWVHQKGLTKLEHHQDIKRKLNLSEGKDVATLYPEFFHTVSYTTSKGAIVDVKYEPVQPTQPYNMYMINGHQYKKGTTIQVRVVRVESFGAIVETTDGFHTTGLIHVSNTRDHFISDMNKWFREGQLVNAQIILEKDPGRLNLSTRHLPLVEHGVQQLTNIMKAPATPSPLNGSAASETAATINEKADVNMDREWQQAKPFIESVIGQITPAAETALKEVMQKQGVFAFTVSLMKVKDNFQPDMGLLLARELAASDKTPGGSL